MVQYVFRKGTGGAKQGQSKYINPHKQMESSAPSSAPKTDGSEIKVPTTQFQQLQAAASGSHMGGFAGPQGLIPGKPGSFQRMDQNLDRLNTTREIHFAHNYQTMDPNSDNLRERKGRSKSKVIYNVDSLKRHNYDLHNPQAFRDPGASGNRPSGGVGSQTQAGILNAGLGNLLNFR